MTASHPPMELAHSPLHFNPPLESLIRMVVSSHGAIDGLNAMADEIGGGDGRKIAALADTLRRGGSIESQIAQVPWNVTTLQAAATQLDATQSQFAALNLPRWLMLKAQRLEAKQALNRTVWFSLGYVLLSLIVGWIVLRFAASLYDYYDFDFSWPKSASGSVAEEIQRVRVIYVGLIGILAGLIILWIARAECWSKIAIRSKLLNYLYKLVASFWYRFPLIGSTNQAIDQAEMCESISLSLTCGWTFPEACRWTAIQTHSPSLLAWLEESAGLLERGESIAASVKHSPFRSAWLPVMIDLYSLEQSQVSMADRWRSLSDNLHSLMNRRRRRTTACLLPLATALSILIFLLGWSFLTKTIFSFITMI